MSSQELWMITGMALVTFAMRYPVLALVGRAELPAGLVAAMKFLPPAVLTAIIVPAIFMPDGTLSLHYTNAYLIAGAAAALIAWRSRNLLLTIVLGMGIFWIWRVLFGT